MMLQQIPFPFLMAAFILGLLVLLAMSFMSIVSMIDIYQSLSSLLQTLRNKIKNNLQKNR